jgi:hypothetical protein
LLQSRCSDDNSSVHSDNSIVPACLDHLAVDTRWPKHVSDDSFVELESVRGDQRNQLQIHPVRNVSKQVQCVAVASFANCRRRPKPTRDVDHNEDPDLLVFASDDCSDLVGLKFRDGKALNFLMTKAATAGSCSFQPTMNRIPSDSLDSSNSRLIEAFDTEGGDSVKRGPPMVESIIRCPVCRAERLSTNPTLIATTLSPPSPIEAVANDDSQTAFSGARAVRVGTAQIFHGWRTFGDARTDNLDLSLKLYHGSKLQWGYQYLMTEGPISEGCRARRRTVQLPGSGSDLFVSRKACLHK